MDKKREVLLFIFGILVLGIILGLIFIFQNQRNSVSADAETTASFSLSPSSADVILGGYQKFEIIIDGDILSKEAGVKLKYDPSVLAIIDQNPNQEGIQIDAGNVYQDYYENTVDQNTGTITISAASKDSVTISSPRVFATFYVKIIKKFAATSINFVFKKDATSDSNLFCLSLDKNKLERDCLQGVLNAYLEMK